MDLTVFSLKDPIPDEYEEPLQWPSNSPFPFTVRQVKNAFDDIYKYMNRKDQLNIFLPTNESINNEEIFHNLRERISEWGNPVHHGFVHATKSLTVLLNLEPINIPDGIKLELFIIFPDRPCTIMCVTDNIHNRSHEEYVLQLARNVNCRLRKFTCEHLSVLYGLIGKAEMVSYGAFSRRMEDIRIKTSQFCNPDSLVMNEEKCDHMIKAFLASIATTDLVSVMKPKGRAHKLDDEDFKDSGFDDCLETRCDEDTLWIFTPEQFKIFVNVIDRDLEFVRFDCVPKSGETLLFEEVSRRLDKTNTKRQPFQKLFNRTVFVASHQQFQQPLQQTLQQLFQSSLQQQPFQRPSKQQFHVPETGPAIQDAKQLVNPMDKIAVQDCTVTEMNHVRDEVMKKKWQQKMKLVAKENSDEQNLRKGCELNKKQMERNQKDLHVFLEKLKLQFIS